jgi:DNA-binding transcriptional ArsR family regulator
MAASTDRLSSTFSALADPTRRAILMRLSHSEATLSDLAQSFDMTLQAVALHLKVLERGGLVTRGRRAQTRPAHLDAAPLEEATRWLLQYRHFWKSSFERLDDYLKALQGDDVP